NIGPPWSAWTVPGLDGASTLLAAAAVVPSQSERRAVVSGRVDRSPRSSRSTVVSLLRSDVLHRWIAVGAGFGSADASLKDDGSIEVFAAKALAKRVIEVREIGQVNELEVENTGAG